MESLQLKTCLSPKVHFLIVEAGRSRKKMEEGVSCLTSEGFIHWEQARCYLSGILINMYILHGGTVRFVDLCIYIYTLFQFGSDRIILSAKCSDFLSRHYYISCIEEFSYKL